MDEKNRTPQVDTAGAVELFKKLSAADQAALLAKFGDETVQFLLFAWTKSTRPNLLAHLQELGLLSGFLEAENETMHQGE